MKWYKSEDSNFFVIPGMSNEIVREEDEMCGSQVAHGLQILSNSIQSVNSIVWEKTQSKQKDAVTHRISYRLSLKWFLSNGLLADLALTILSRETR